MRLAFRRNHDSADSPPYLSLLNLHTAPFSSKGGNAFFYADAERKQYLDMLQHLTQYSEELLLVSGEAGIGKTALLDKYLERSEEHWRVCRLEGGQGVELDALFTRVAECFAVDMSAVQGGQLLDALRQHLDALLEQQLSVLVIDDAHALSDDALEMVFHLATLAGEHGKLIRVLLFADSAIEARLNSERFTALASPHSLRLKPLTEADSSAYLLHRLQQAGYSGPSPFSSDELKQLYRQSQGKPAQLSESAHAMLLKRTEKEGNDSGFNKNGMRVGLAATALVGTVLGMQDRINEFLGGSAHNSMAVTAERPVLRLADEDNPWAVVIRDGESIQISCGAPEMQTVAVRPAPAAAPLESQPIMQEPLLKPMEPTEVEPTEPVVEATKPESAVPEPPEMPEPQPEPTETPATPSIVPDLAPEVAKPEPAVEPSLSEKLSLNQVLPSPVVGSDQPQTLIILGSGIEPKSKVAVSWSGNVKVLEPSQVVVRNPKHMELTLTTGTEAAKWAVQVSTPSRKRSNVLRFEVQVPGAPASAPEEAKPLIDIAPSLEAEAVTKVEGPAPEKPEAVAAAEPVQPEAPKSLVEKVETKPEAAPAPQPEPVKPVATKPAPPKTPSGDQMLGADWVAKQPANNFTLQLLATADLKALKAFAKQKNVKGPLARYEQMRGGKRLHVLTQGSYPSRKAAETAAKQLPKGVKPWVRDFAGVKKAMSTTSAKRIKASAGGNDAAWVWSQDPKHFTIQLAGAAQESTLKKMIEGISLRRKVVILESQRKGKPWYLLAYGQFENRAEAQQIAAALPARFKTSLPWIREFSALQGELSQ